MDSKPVCIPDLSLATEASHFKQQKAYKRVEAQGFEVVNSAPPLYNRAMPNLPDSPQYITCVCEVCSSPFLVRASYERYRLRKGLAPTKFCSKECHRKSQYTATFTTFTCTVCDKEFSRRDCQAKKSTNHFCSRSCAAKYNNAHKSTGTRRSKLEVYIEQQLRSDFPDLELVCNGKDAIRSELDFYFPQLRLAIELNGVFHYEPIYGPDKLERIQSNDQQKFLACAAAGIELAVIDISQVINVTKSAKERYYTIVRDLVVRVIRRADGTNVQVP